MFESLGLTTNQLWAVSGICWFLFYIVWNWPMENKYAKPKPGPVDDDLDHLLEARKNQITSDVDELASAIDSARSDQYQEMIKIIGKVRDLGTHLDRDSAMETEQALDLVEELAKHVDSMLDDWIGLPESEI